MRKKHPRLRQPRLRVKQVVSTCLQQKHGFSLVELITTLCLLLLLLGVISSTFIKQVRFCQKIAVACSKEQIKNFVIEKIKGDARTAQEILPDSNKERLVLRVDEDRIEYSIVNYKVRRRKNSYTQYLTDKNEILNLSFSYPANKTVEVSLEDFVARVSLRN